MSCQKKTVDGSLLESAVLLSEKYPDSALHLLDSIRIPESSLTKKEYNIYLVTKVQVRYKLYYDVKRDTSIFNAAQYFNRNDQNLKFASLANFYSACVKREQGNYEEAMTYYKDAESYASKLQDSSVLGLVNFNIGDVYAKMGLYDKALDRYNLAVGWYEKFPDKQANSYSSVGRMYFLKKQTDSAFHYLHMGLAVAKKINNQTIYSQLAASLGVAYEDAKEYDKAEQFLKESYLHNGSNDSRLRYCLNLGILYGKIVQTDSVAKYASLLEDNWKDIKSMSLQSSVLSFLTALEKSKGNFAKALDYQTNQMQVLKNITEERSTQAVFKIEQEYDYEQLQKNHYLELATRQKWVITLLGVIIIGGVFFIFYTIRQKNKEVEFEGNLNTLRNMNIDLEDQVLKKQNDLRRDLLWRFDVAKKVLKINSELARKGNASNDKVSLISQFNNIVYGESSLDQQWEALLQTFMLARPGYTEKIKSTFPNLTEAEFRVCILTYADFNVKEIAIVLNQSPNTVQARRTTLRQKMGVPLAGDIVRHIDASLG